MTHPSPILDPSAVPPRVRVWDLPTRLFHWGLVGAVATATLIGYLGPEWWLDAHVWAGYGVALLLGFRLVWGLFGGEYSRFRRFLYSRRELRRHLGGVLRGRPPHYLGHNPAGALMIFAVLALLAGMVVTGLLALGGVEHQGPLAGLTGFGVGQAARTLHEGMALLLLALVAGHLAGVLIESLLARENLVRAMVTGDKHRPPDLPTDPAPARRWAALAGLGVLGLGTGVGLAKLPAPQPRTLPELAAYQEECGACHNVYHPSLLPAASWQDMLEKLDQHFGEDASLEPAKAAAIKTYLMAQAAETWDTEAAHGLRQVAPDQPWRISASPFWVKRHDELPDALFQPPAVAGKGDCQACHQDAAQGQFADQKIRIAQANPKNP